MSVGVKYSVQTGEFTGEQLEEEGAGGCDALLMVSIMRDGKHAHDGPMSVRYFSVDGTYGKPLEETPQIPNTELFTIMTMIAKDLSEDESLPDWQRDTARRTFEEVRARVTNPLGSL